jgi:tetratricopeptide (TPR) repeat protein
MIPSDKLILRIREFLEREEGENAAAIASWGLARPDLDDVTRANLLAFKAHAIMILGDPQEAGRLLDEAQGMAATPEIVLIGVELLLALQDHNKALGLLEGNWELISNDSRAYVLRARVLAACNEIDEALALLDELTQQENIPRGTFRALSQILIFWFGGDVALEAARRAALGGYPTSTDLLLYGQTLLDVKKGQEAFDAFEGAFYLHPGAVGSLLGAFESLIQIRHYEHAMRLVDLMLTSPMIPGLMRIELTKALILLGRNNDAARISYEVLKQSPQEFSALISLAMLANHEGRVDDTKLFLDRIDKAENNEIVARIKAEYFLRRGEWQNAWKIIMPFLRPIGPPAPPSIPSLLPGADLKDVRILIRACHPFRFLGLTPALRKQGATVHILTHPNERDAIACVTEEPIITPDKCQAEDFDFVIEDIRLPLMTTDMMWPQPSQPADKKKQSIGLALKQPYGTGPGFDLPETVVHDIQERLKNLGYEMIILEEGSLVDYLDTIKALDGVVIAIDGPLMDLAAGLGITTVLLASLVTDPLWLSPLGEQYYPALRVVRQPQYNSWEGVAEKVENIFKERID